MRNFLATFSKPGFFRLFLSVLVVLFHSSRYFPFGDFAVLTFFILSGYWIYRMYDTHYKTLKNPYRTFIWGRILRIYPLYYLCTFIALVIVAINPTIFAHGLSDFLNFNQIFSIITLVTYSYLEEKLLIPAWSLGIELQFYLIVPFFIYLLKKTNGFWFLLTIILITVLAVINKYETIRFSVFSYLIFFSIGMLIWEYKLMISKKIAVYSLVVIAVIIVLHYSIPVLQDALFNRTLKIGNIKYYVIFGRVLPLFFIPFIIFNLNQKSGKTDRALGDLSYTVYIFHWIPFSIYNYYFANSPAIVRGPAWIMYLIILGACSWFIYIAFEKRIEELRKNLLTTS